jgi:hypothetical protein
MEPPRKIDRIAFLIHPYCWSLHCEIPADRDPVLWKASLARELRNHRDHLQFISGMGPGEVLAIYPIGDSPPMRALVEHARARLGPRCQVITWRVANPAPLLAGVRDPIRRWLDTDDPLPGKEQYVRDTFSDFGARPMREDVAGQVEEEIRQACSVIGYDWLPAAIKVIYYNRAVALEIEEHFRRNGLTFDPRTVEGLAFGEGFAACAMTWKCMLPGYLGLARPIENDFDLSTEGLAFLNEARLRERLDLGGDLRLFLIEGPEGLPVALFARAQARLADPYFYARLPLAALPTLEIPGSWPPAGGVPHPLHQEDGQLFVPVHTGLRRGLEGRYLLAPGMDFDGFASAMTRVEVVPGPPGWSLMTPPG